MPEKVKSKRGHLRTSAGRRQSLRVRLPIVGVILFSTVSSWLILPTCVRFSRFYRKNTFENFEHFLIV